MIQITEEEATELRQLVSKITEENANLRAVAGAARKLYDAVHDDGSTCNETEIARDALWDAVKRFAALDGGGR